MKNKNKLLTIGWLYPELMSTYGDRGNIIALQKRCEWRGIEVEVRHLDVGFNHEQLATCDLLFMGGAQDRQQKIVGEDLKKKRSALKKMVESYTPGVYICGAYQFLGKYYKEADGTMVDGLGILDLYTESPGENVRRLIGNVVIELGSNILRAIPSLPRESREVKKVDSSRLRSNNNYLVGFENHGGRTYLGDNVKPLGKVIVGFGNNGEDKTEGAVYKNSFGSYLHGPILPKNPHFADLLIRLALEKKYGEKVTLVDLNDTLEWQAHEAILKRRNI